MLLLTSTSDKIQVTTGAAATIDVHASYMDFDGTNVTPGRKNTPITTATTTDVVLAPLTSVFRNVKSLTVANKDVVSCACTVKHTDGTNTPTLFSATLAPGDMIEFVDGVGFVVRPAYATSQLQNVSTADQSPTAATLTYLTGSLIALPRTAQVGSIYRWKVHLAKSAAGTGTTSFDIRFGTNGTTADTARCSTGALDTETAIADEMVAEIWATVRGPIGASCIVQSSWMFDDNLTTTGFSNTARKSQVKAVQSAAFDITPTGTKVGLTITSGAADVVTIRQVTAEGFNL
jgi:hypothetical protein